MRLALNTGLSCGHFTDRREIDCDLFDDDMITLHLKTKGYCPKCNDFMETKRINLFVIEREVPEIT